MPPAEAAGRAFIVISGAPNSMVGIAAEYQMLGACFGPRGQRWQIEHQELDRTPEGHPLDVMRIRLRDGVTQTVYFDLSEFIGRTGRSTGTSPFASL